MLTAKSSGVNLNNESGGSKLRVYVLGRFLIEQGDRAVESEHWRSGKARSLFKILLSRRGLQISRQEVAELLWPELDQERAANNLNQAVYSLRRTLEPHLKHASDSIYVKTEGSKIQLNPTLIDWVDFEEFKQLYKQAQLTGELEIYEQAASLYGGDYLPEDLYEDWSVGRRENLRQEWSELLMQMALLYQARGLDEKYRQCLRRILETDFSHEDSVQKLMRALNEVGRRDEALTVYRNFAEKLQKRLNIEPLAETRQLFKDISAGKLPSRAAPTSDLRNASAESLAKNEAKVALESAAWKSPTVITEPIEIPVSKLAEVELIGRQEEQQVWQQLLQNKNGAMVLLQGTSGVGKTKLTENFVKHATASGLEIVYTICYPEFAEIPFTPLGNLLEQALSKLTEAEQEDFFKLCPPSVATLLPNFVRPLSQVLGSPEHVTPQVLFSTTAQMLNWLGKKRRFLFVIEDLHFLNSLTLKFFCYLLTQAGQRSFHLLGTCRLGANKPELHFLVDRIKTSRQTILQLDDLPQAEVEQLLQAYLGQPVGPQLFGQVDAATCGNPRLTHDYVELLRTQARIYLSNGRWELLPNRPTEINLPKLSATVQDMLAGLRPETQTLLKLGSVIGNFFRFETIRQIVFTRQDGAGWWIDLEKTNLGQALKEALESCLLREEKEGYRFTYPILANGLLQSLPPQQRKCWREVVEWAQKQPVNNQLTMPNGGFDSND